MKTILPVSTTLCAVAGLLIASGASAQNLFEADSENIYEFTPGGVRTNFAGGVDSPVGVAFNSAGDLFEADFGTGNIYEFTPSGTRSTFASGLNPYGLAFNSAGDLFVADGGGNIYEFTPGGVKSTFAYEVQPEGLAFQGITLPVPEPSAWALLAMGSVALLGCLRLRRRSS